MASPAPSRSRPSAHLGLHRYFLTILTAGRRPVFASSPVLGPVQSHLLRAAADHRFAVLAYCFLPDHLHALVEGTSESSDFQRFVRVFKQVSGRWYRQHRAASLWGAGYYDRVVGDEETSVLIGRYMVEHHGRSGAAMPHSCPFSDSERFVIKDVIEFVGD